MNSLTAMNFWSMYLEALHLPEQKSLMQRARNQAKSREKWQGPPNLEHPWKAISCDNSHPPSAARGPAIIAQLSRAERVLSPVSRINTLDPTQQVKGLEGGKGVSFMP